MLTIMINKLVSQFSVDCNSLCFASLTQCRVAYALYMECCPVAAREAPQLKRT